MKGMENGLLDRSQMVLASVDRFLKWGQTRLFLFLAMIRGWCTQMEAKIEKKGKACGCFHRTFYHLALLILFYLIFFFNEREGFFGFNSSLRWCGQVSSTLPTLILNVENIY